MARKKVLEAVADAGRKPEAEETSLDSPQKQVAALVPEEHEVKLVDGSSVKFKTDLTPNLVIKKLIGNDLEALYKMVVYETSKLSGDANFTDIGQWFSRNSYYIYNIVANRTAIKNFVFDILGKLTNEPPARFSDNVTPDNVSLLIDKLLAMALKHLIEAATNEKK